MCLNNLLFNGKNVCGFVMLKKDDYCVIDDAMSCPLYTSDAADDLHRVDLGGRRIIT